MVYLKVICDMCGIIDHVSGVTFKIAGSNADVIAQNHSHDPLSWKNYAALQVQHREVHYEREVMG